jgi:hypothetical protein
MPLLGREWIRQMNISEMVQDLNTSSLHTLIEQPDKVKSLLEKYRTITEKRLSKIEGIQAKLTLKPNCNPVFIKARAIPFKLKHLVEAELENLVREGVLEKVASSEWATPRATPIVPVLKNNGQIRICGDFKVTLNPALIIDEHPLSTIDELFSTMSGRKFFSKIDLRQAYLQMEVREQDRSLLTINTHKGLYRCSRLLYGVASAPAIW